MITTRVMLGLSFLLALFLLVPAATFAAQVNVSMGPNYFTPANITINVGDSVVWTNTDTMPHTVTANNYAFNSGTIQPGAVYSRTFTTPGTYSYVCTLHAGMNGTITVLSSTSQPTPTPNSTADQLRAQIEGLLLQIQQLQNQFGSGGLPPVGPIADSSACPLIGRILYIGSSGDDVTRLQQFLARDPSIYPERLVTGHYGPLTEAAVKRWQVKYNVVSSGDAGTTGFGQVGPRTAAAMSLQCTTTGGGGGGGTTAPVGGFIRVTPISGSAPLAVSVEVTVNTVNSCTGALYTLNWGDGTTPAQVSVPVGNCQQLVYTLNHTYQSSGTYQVMLSAGAHSTFATVTVHGGTSSPADPTVSGFTVTPTISGSNFVVRADFDIATPCSAYDLDWGDGSAKVTQAQGGPCTQVITPKSFTHTYSQSGSYTIRLQRGTRVDTVSIVASSQ